MYVCAYIYIYTYPWGRKTSAAGTGASSSPWTRSRASRCQTLRRTDGANVQTFIVSFQDSNKF